MIWGAEGFNHNSVIVSNIENIILKCFVFWKLHSKSTSLKNQRGPLPLTLHGHDASESSLYNFLYIISLLKPHEKHMTKTPLVEYRNQMRFKNAVIFLVVHIF